jgi:hypothetical protein
MKKLIAILVLIVLPVMSFGEDITGQNNTVILSDYITDVYYEVAGFVSIANAYTFVESTMVINRINAARENCVNRFPAVQRDTIIVIVANTESYALPSDFNRVRYVTSIVRSTGEEVAMRLANEDFIGLSRDATGAPQFYLVDKRTIKIIPANNANDSVVVHYIARSNVLSATTDTCNIDKEYEEYVILTASEKILRGKAPSMGEFGKARLEDIGNRLKIEEERLIKSSKSLFDIMPK